MNINVEIKTIYSGLFFKGMPQMVYHTDPWDGGFILGKQLQSKYPSSKSVGHKYFLFFRIYKSTFVRCNNYFDQSLLLNLHDKF